jgi:hypothetical protein
VGNIAQYDLLQGEKSILQRAIFHIIGQKTDLRKNLHRIKKNVFLKYYKKSFADPKLWRIEQWPPVRLPGTYFLLTFKKDKMLPFLL